MGSVVYLYVQSLCICLLCCVSWQPEQDSHLSLSPHSVLVMEDTKLEDTEAGVEYNEEAIHQRIEDLCQCIEEKQRLVKLKREELRK